MKLVLLTIALFPAPLYAVVKATLNRTAVAVGDTVTIEIEVQDSNASIGAVTTQPSVPVRQAGTQNSVTIINGKVARKASVSYNFTPDKPGTWLVLPIAVTLGSNTDHTETLALTVQAAAAGFTLEITSFVEPETVYEGQAFLLRARFFHGASVIPKSWTPPDSDAVAAYAGQPEAVQKSSSVNRGGENFSMIDISRWMIANRAGKLNLSGGLLEYTRADVNRRRDRFGFADPMRFFDSESRFQQAIPAVLLTVLRLPELPADTTFSGLIGSLTPQWQAQSRGADRSTGVLRISGKGTAPAPGFQEWQQSGWKIYPQAASIKQSLAADGTPEIRVDIPLTLVPDSQAGNDHMPVYFNPNSRHYEPIMLPLPPPAAGTRPAAQPQIPEPEAFGKLALPPAPENANLLLPRSLEYGIVAALLSLMLFAGSFWRRSKRPPDWQQILQRALDQDSQAGWEQAYQKLSADSSTPQTLNRKIADALYAPSAESPADSIREWLQINE